MDNLADIESNDGYITIRKNGVSFTFDVGTYIVDEKNEDVMTIPQPNGQDVEIRPRTILYTSSEAPDGPIVKLEMEAEEMEVLESIISRIGDKVTELNPLAN